MTKLSPMAATELQMTDAQLKARLLEEESKAFTGWDFSYLKGRWQTDAEPWDYRDKILAWLKPTDKLLDMGTGGGEFLLALGHPLEQCSVTEGYPPNLALCRERLEPLGMTVKPVDETDHLDYPDACFDLVINRHESYDLTEVRRVLKPGGIFITQQVGGTNDADLVRKLNPNYQPELPDHILSKALKAAQEAGFEVLESAEYRGPLRFLDLGALVYFASVVPWEFENFSVENDFERLLALREELQATGAISGTEERFLVIAQKRL